MPLLGEEIQLTLWDCVTETVRGYLYFPHLFQFVGTEFLTDYLFYLDGCAADGPYFSFGL